MDAIGQILPNSYEHYSKLSFQDFIKAREDARITETKDEVIRKYRFTNIDRNHDYGTKLLMSNMCNDFKTNIAIATHYRYYGSPRDYFDLENKKISSRAYQTPRMEKGKTPYQVAKEIGNEVYHNITEDMIKDKQIREVADILIDMGISGTRSNFMYVFHSNEIAKDIAAIYPNLVSPTSECYIGRGAVYGLNAMNGTYPKSIPLRGKGTIQWTLKNADKIYNLMFDNWTFCDIEHALCEYGKYLRLLKFGKGAKKR